MKNYSFLLFLALSIVACNTDPTMDTLVEEPTGENQVLVDNIFGCRQFAEMLIDDDFIVNRPVNLETFGRYFVYGGSYDLVVRDGFQGPVLKKIAMQTRGLQRYENKLMICAAEGIFALDQAGGIDTLSTSFCASIVLDAAGRLLVQGIIGPNTDRTTVMIHEYKNDTFIPFARVDPYFECALLDLVAAQSGGLYVRSCENELSYYENGVLKAFYRQTESPFEGNDNSADLFQLADHQSGLFVISQPTIDRFGIHRFTGGEWATIYNLQRDGWGRDPKASAVYFWHYNPIIKGEYLYSFCSGSTDGFLRFKLSGSDEKTLDDIDLVKLPNIPSQYIRGIVTPSDGHTYVVVNRRKIVRINC